MRESEAVRLAKEEIKSAKERIRAAKILLENNQIADSINRSYYAMFHAARGLLILEGEQPKNHNGKGING